MSFVQQCLSLATPTERMNVFCSTARVLELSQVSLFLLLKRTMVAWIQKLYRGSQSLNSGPRWHGWGTALQTCWSRVRFPGVDSGSHRNKYQEYFLGGKPGRCLWLTTYHLHVPIVLKFWEPRPPGTLKACPGLWWDCFALRYQSLTF
jgi:hypothetical protein